MIQSATAEMMHAQGQGRRTFRLAPSVKVHRTTSFTVDEAHNMTCMELWTKIASDLSSTPNRSQIIDLVIMSFTRMRNGEVKAHTALGGASLALFGSGSLFTWPVDVLQIPKRMLDFRTFDTKFFFDDSAGRSSIMGRRACTATTIGALLHELGHCLSLPHPCADATKNGGGIMSRGFDHFDRLFVQPQHATHFPFWDRGSAIRLRHHQFLQFEYERTRFRTQALNNSPMPSSHSAPSDSAPSFGRLFNGIVFCRTQAGLGHVGYYRNGDNASHEEFSGIPPREFELPSLADLRCRCRAKSSDRLVISAIDVQGRISEVDYDQIMDFPA